jgi:hypothetical protein
VMVLCLYSGADCNVVSGCFITAKKFGVVDGTDYQVSVLRVLVFN